MYKEILKIMRCPICHSPLQLDERTVVDEEIIEGQLSCTCGHTYAIHEGVIDFCSKEQSDSNAWSEYYKETDYESLDALIEATKTQKEKEEQQKLLDSMLEEVREVESGYVLDIASGRGMLLTKLVQVVKESVSVIATDLSFEVLKYDRMKVKKIRPDLHVNYIACDATNLPLLSDSINMSVSFFGNANMYGAVEAGIQEAARTLRPNAMFLNSFVVIEESSKGYSILKDYCTQNEMCGIENNYLQASVKQFHDLHFINVEDRMICEGIAEAKEEQIDLLPYPGDWYAYMIYACSKKG